MTKIQEKIIKIQQIIEKDSYRKLMTFLSHVDDVVHFDFNNKYSKENKTGFDKTFDLMNELVLYIAYKADEMNTFYNISNYNINTQLIIDYLEKDADVNAYLNRDLRTNNRLNKKFKNIIKLLKETYKIKNE